MKTITKALLPVVVVLCLITAVVAVLCTSAQPVHESQFVPGQLTNLDRTFLVSYYYSPASNQVMYGNAFVPWHHGKTEAECRALFKELEARMHTTNLVVLSFSEL